MKGAAAAFQRNAIKLNEAGTASARACKQPPDAFPKNIMPRYLPPSLPRFFGVSVAAVALAVAPLHAAFEIKGELPASLDVNAVRVLRESLENRSSDPVATLQLTHRRFSGKIDSGPGLFSIQIGDTTLPFVAADGQALEVKADGPRGALRVTGAPDQELFLAYEAFRADSLARKVTPARAAIATASDPAEIARLTEREVTGYIEHRRELNDFTLSKLRGSPALYAASLRWDGDYRLDELAAAVREYAAAIPNAEIGRLMNERIARFRATAVGAQAPTLAGPMPEGGTLALADLKGRYVLVDFWASWCSPCRVENRNYVELYKRHRAAGFEILAASVDQNGPAWKAAIAKDEATWRHISDLTGWKTPLAGAYNVTALPASFLIDPNGKIIAKDLRGQQLAQKLEEVLSGKK